MRVGEEKSTDRFARTFAGKEGALIPVLADPFRCYFWKARGEMGLQSSQLLHHATMMQDNAVYRGGVMRRDGHPHYTFELSLMKLCVFIVGGPIPTRKSHQPPFLRPACLHTFRSMPFLGRPGNVQPCCRLPQIKEIPLRVRRLVMQQLDWFLTIQLADRVLPVFFALIGCNFLLVAAGFGASAQDIGFWE